jgi:hypothetical protein
MGLSSDWLLQNGLLVSVNARQLHASLKAASVVQPAWECGICRLPVPGQASLSGGNLLFPTEARGNVSTPALW